MHKMSDIIKSFGYNAGKIWSVLQDEGPQVQTKLLKTTGLRNEEFYGAIGWLARENKVYKEKRTYKVGVTNLTNTIGANAGKVWDILSKNSEVDVSAIARIAKIPKYDCYAALGWLAREGKITAKVKVRKK